MNEQTNPDPSHSEAVLTEPREAKTGLMQSIGLLLFALVVVFSAGLIGNLATIPNIPVWYAGLTKPSFNPPNWIFAPVWSTLYAMMVLSFWRVLLRRSHWQRPGWQIIGVFVVQMALNAFWSVAFFGMHNPALGLGVVILLEAMILLTILTFKPIDRFASWLLVPYALWVGFATILNGAIVALN